MARDSIPSTLFGQRLREARTRANIPQDKLGVLIGIDEGCSSARISRYESGIHDPPFETATRIAEVLNVPVAFFYCTDERLARLIVNFASLGEEKQKILLDFAAELSN